MIVVSAVALLAISSSAVLVRGMEAGPAAIAAWRCTGAAVVLAPSLVQLRGVGRKDGARLAGAGLLLGLHFWSWFVSLEGTTVLRSTLLVALVPFWSALIGFARHRRVPHRGYFVGVTVASAGLITMGGAGERSAWWGDAAAVIAGLLWALYLEVGASLRRRLSTTTWMGSVSLVAGMSMAAVALYRGERLTGYPPSTWGLIGLAVLGPQLVGHQGISYTLRYVPAPALALIALLEPVGASLLAGVWLGEWPRPRAWVGMMVVLLGVGIALGLNRARRRSWWR